MAMAMTVVSCDGDGTDEGDGDGDTGGDDDIAGNNSD